MAEGAEAGDALCAAAFSEAGKRLALHVVAVSAKMEPELRAEAVTIVCMGSVWKSWPKLRQAFCATLAAAPEPVAAYRLVRLTGSPAVGAAVLGARSAGVAFAPDLAANVELLHAHP